VPLSEHERRQLEQIEAALRAGDPRFAGAVRAADPRVHYRRRVVAAALGFLVGVGLLLTGGRGQCHLGGGSGLCGLARLHPVGGDQLPAHDRPRPRQGQGPGQQTAYRSRRYL